MDMSTNKQLRPFGMRDKIGYAFGDFGCNMSFAFINSYLMLFYVTCMKIDPKHFAVLILLGKIFDAINDPIIGGLCDATMLAGCPVALGILLVKPMLKKFTKKQLCTYPFVLSAISAGVAAFVRIRNPYVWIVLVAIAMFGSAFYLTLMWALVADCIDYQERRTGRREESSIYATYSLFRKIAQGVGAAVVSWAIGMTGYDQKLGALEQAAGVPEKIYFVTAFLPFIGALISLISMHFLYNLDDNAQEKVK